jgi:hypothetical protein
MSKDIYTGWHKSSRSGGTDNCVEIGVAIDGASVGVRDTKDNGGGPILDFNPVTWDAFLNDVRLGRFDLY